MKKVFLVIISILFVGISCTEQSTELTDEQKAAIISEVEDQARGVISAGMVLNSEEFMGFFSEDNFISVNSDGRYYATRSAWAEFVKFAHSSVENRTYESTEIRVVPLAGDLALNTAEITVENILKSGELSRAYVVTTGLWEKEADGWKMIHAHESWQAIAE